MSEESKPAKVRKGDGRRERGNRTGFTTGACSAAAAKAATLGLLNSEVADSVVCRLPNGSEVTFAVTDGYVEEVAGLAHAVIVKDAGDDPDATHGAHMTADVRILKHRAGEVAAQGRLRASASSPGRVSGLAVGGPAINPVPQPQHPRQRARRGWRPPARSRRPGSDHFRARRRRNGEEDSECPPRHPRRHLDPRHHRHRPAVLDRCLPRQRRAGGRCGGEAGPDHASMFTTGGRSEKFAMRQLPDARRGLLRADG
jgi:hypothetical protein